MSNFNQNVKVGSHISLKDIYKIYTLYTDIHIITVNELTEKNIYSKA